MNQVPAFHQPSLGQYPSGTESGASNGSKVPFGWENLQSSSNRIPLDRNDGLNSAVRNERDLGVFYYYTPEFAQDLFKSVLERGLKGSYRQFVGDIIRVQFQMNY